MMMQARLVPTLSFFSCLMLLWSGLFLSQTLWTSSSTSSSPFGILAYVVTVPNVVPLGRQVKFLKELTTDLVSGTPPGQLSDRQLAISHELIHAWSRQATGGNSNTLPLPVLHSKRSNSASSSSSSTSSSNTSTQYRKECALQVELLLKRVIDERQAGNADALLDTNDYNCLLEGWARSGLGELSALRTEQILQAMQEDSVLNAQTQPNLSSFKACLMAWRLSNVPFAAVRAQRILNWMLQLHSSGQNIYALPDADCFDIVLQLWSRSGQHDQAPQQAEGLLAVMEQVYRQTNDGRLQPRSSSFNAVLAAWSKSTSVSTTTSTHKIDVADRCLRILSYMNACADAFADATHEASSGSNTLSTMAPDTVSYNIVMGILAKHGGNDASVAAHKADALLRHVLTAFRLQQEQRVQYSTMTQVVPERILFNIAIGLWAKTGTTKAYRKARSILDRHLALIDEYGSTNSMVGQIEPPDIVGWTSVLSCCANECGHAEERDKALRVAIATYRQLQKLQQPNGRGVAAAAAQPNHVTYGTMLKACAKLHPIRSPLRRKWVEIVWTDAVQAGCVSDMVVTRMREAAPHDLYQHLLQGHARQHLPAAWTSNVCEYSENRYKQAKRSGKKRAEV